MLQVAVGVAAGMMLAAFVSGCGGDAPSVIKSAPATQSPFEIAPDGVDVKLPSSQASPAAGYGTPLAGASPMPSVKKYTHTMFDQ